MMARTAGMMWKWIGLAVLAVLAIATVGFVFAPKEAPTASAKVATFTPSPAQTAKPVIRVAAVGDSTTEGSAPDFNHGATGPLSWPNYLPDGMAFAGGWAKGGATTQLMRDSVSAVDADVLVVIAGTNDGGKVPFATSADNIKAIVAKVGIKRVIVSSIAPRDANPAMASDYNAQLMPFVKAQGWEFVDGWAGVRTANNQYVPGMTKDGIHPTDPAVNILAQAIAAKINAPG